MKFFRILKKSMLINLLLGISSGLPLLLTSKTLQAWMSEEKVDLKLIGLFSLVGLPYTLKFLWSPIFDRFTLPFLGRRRGWLLLTQILLAISLLFLAGAEPQKHTVMVALLALFVSFFSASQDIVIDAYRRESLTEEELAMGSTLYVYGYRIALWITGGFALILADHISWHMVYLLMAAAMLIGITTTLCATEPEVKEARAFTIFEPLKEFFSRTGAIEILLFILLYKLGDSMAGAMSIPFYLNLGFSKTEIGAIAKTFGFFSSLAGGFAGAIIILRVGISRSLWIFGALQALSVAGLSIMAHLGHNPLALTWAIVFEDFTAGMGTAAFTAYMASLTNKRFTATQYALLTSLMGIPRVLLSAPTGYLAASLGWSAYFIFCTLAAVPGMLLLLRVAPWHKRSA